jgi:hypothetical protein
VWVLTPKCHTRQAVFRIFALAALMSLALPAQAFADSLDVLGAYDPGSSGYNSSVVGLDGVAYLGSWGGPAECPSLGVRVIDVHDPTNPTPITTAAAYQGTTAEHLAAVHYATPSFTGSVLFAGIQRCQPGGAAPSGLAIWDITDPSNPAELGFISTGRGSRGVHEFTVAKSPQGDRWLAYLAVPNSEATEGTGDLRIVDVTDPRHPDQLTAWGARKNAGLPVGTGAQCAPYCRGSVPQAFLHSVALSLDGRTAYLSYWDLGVIILDVSEPNVPRWLGRFAEPQAAEGNTHSVSLAHDGKLALVADETFSAPWGRLRLVDVQDPANPVQVGAFDTPNSAAGTPGEQYAYTIHNPITDDRNTNRAYLAWYADGVRLVDISDASHPIELTSWIPPNGGMIWNVAFMGDLLLAADINNGLFVLRR